MEIYRILVTGGNGFLGQHVVKLLQEKADWVTHVRVLDLQPFQNQLDYDLTKSIESVVGSVTDESVVESATKGVNSVIHLASKISVSTFVDEKQLEAINVGGTEKLLNACVKQNVGRFVYCSSQDVVIGHEDIIDANEDLGKPQKFMFGKYAETKYDAERMVISKDKSLMRNGKTIRTLSVRPVLMYGEMDPHFISYILQTTKKTGGTFVRFTGSGSYNAYAYVGNVAWAFICAARSLDENSGLGGEAFFAGDDTPLTNVFDLCKPYLESRGMKVSSYVLPVCLIYLSLIVWTIIVKLISPIIKIDSQFTYSSIASLSLKLSFQYSKAATLLGYRPLYSAEESRRRSLEYYSRIKI